MKDFDFPFFQLNGRVGSEDCKFGHVNQALFQLEKKNTEIIENWVQIIVESLLLRHNTFPVKKIQVANGSVTRKKYSRHC